MKVSRHLHKYIRILRKLRALIGAFFMYIESFNIASVVLLIPQYIKEFVLKYRSILFTLYNIDTWKSLSANYECIFD